jgi:type I restriction enzyme S subunit
MKDWKETELGEILELVYRKSLSKRKDGSIPVFRSNGIVGYHNEAFLNIHGIIIGRKGSAGNVAFV